MVSTHRNLMDHIEIILYECLQVDVDTSHFIFIWTIPWFSWCWFIEISGAEILCLIVLFPKFDFCHGIDSLFIHDTHHRFHFSLCRVARKNRWERCTDWTGAKEKCPLTCKVCSWVGTTGFLSFAWVAKKTALRRRCKKKTQVRCTHMNMFSNSGFYSEILKLLKNSSAEKQLLDFQI